MREAESFNPRHYNRLIPPACCSSNNRCGLCHGELFVTATAIAEHHAEVAQATAVTMQRLEATADALRRCDARWQRPPESMSFAERLMTWWNRCEDATSSSGEPSSSGAATPAGLEWSLEQSAEDVCGRLVGGLQKVRVDTERGRCRGVAQPAGDGSDVDARRQQASSRR